MARLLDFLNPPIVTTEPPTDADTRRNDWVLLGCVLLLLAAGWLVRWLALDTQRTTDLGIGLPAIAHPSGWYPSTPTGDTSADAAAPNEGVLFEVTNPASPSTFAPVIRIESLPVRQGDDLDTLRMDLGLRRSREFDRYRELTADPVLVLDDRPAVLTTYTFVADPTHASGAYGLPVVVQAQDLLFRQDNRWLIATVAADAAEFAAEEPDFTLFFDSLRLNQDVTFAEPGAAPLEFGASTPEGTQP